MFRRYHLSRRRVAPGVATSHIIFIGDGGPSGRGSGSHALLRSTVGPNVTLPAGLSRQVTATGNYSDGSMQDLTTQVTWASSAPAVATISNSSGSQGVATAVSLGVTTITATLGGVVGSDPLRVKTLTSLVVSPTVTSICPNASIQFYAQGTFSDGSMQYLTSSVTWTSSDTSVATVAINYVNLSGVGDRLFRRIGNDHRASRIDHVERDTQREDAELRNHQSHQSQHFSWRHTAVLRDRSFQRRHHPKRDQRSDLDIFQHSRCHCGKCDWILRIRTIVVGRDFHDQGDVGILFANEHTHGEDTDLDHGKSGDGADCGRANPVLHGDGKLQ